jgi:thiol-disulfide isomerase/thioredoxin
MPVVTRWSWILALLLALPALALADGGDKAVQPKPGDIPPDALGVDLKGNPVTVSQHRGKVVVVTFWASWCPPCRRELPMLAHVQSTVGREYMEVVAINVKESRREFLGVIRANKGIELTYVHDKGAVTDQYGVSGLPNMFIIDREGRVAHVHRGYSEQVFQRFIEEILALLPPEALARPVPAPAT